MSKWPQCGNQNSSASWKLNLTEEGNTKQNYKFYSEYPKPGVMIAQAKNKIGNSTAKGQIIVSDIDRSFMIITKELYYAVGDNVTIECGAIIYNYSNILEWSKGGVKAEKINGIRVESNTTKYSYRKYLTIYNIMKNFSGTYECHAFKKETLESLQPLHIKIHVDNPQAPKISTNFPYQTNFKKSIGDSFEYLCSASGLPKPSLIWYKDNELFIIKKNRNGSRQDIVISDNNFTLRFNYLSEKDSGRYKCHAENRIDKADNEFELIVEGE